MNTTASPFETQGQYEADSYDLQQWSQKLNISTSQLEEAIEAVGTDRVEDYLDKVYY